MHKTLLLGAALLLSTTALGVTIAAAARHVEDRSTAAEAVRAGADGKQRLASEHGSRRHRDSHHKRAAGHDDDEEDDDDDDDDGKARGAGGRQATPAPNAPVPDNGLFSGKARPRVEVQ
jgi:hypothetical protein